MKNLLEEYYHIEEALHEIWKAFDSYKNAEKYKISIYIREGFEEKELILKDEFETLIEENAFVKKYIDIDFKKYIKGSILDKENIIKILFYIQVDTNKSSNIDQTYVVYYLPLRTPSF